MLQGGHRITDEQLQLDDDDRTTVGDTSEHPPVGAVRKPTAVAKKERGPVDAEKERELLDLLDKLQPGPDLSGDDIKGVADKMATLAKDIRDESTLLRTQISLGLLVDGYADAANALNKETKVLGDEIKEQEVRDGNQGRQPEHPALFQTNYSAASVTAEHASLLELHSGFKEIIEKYNVDTSAARTRPKEEHNKLVVDFILDTFAPSLSQLLRENASSEGTTQARVGGKCLHGMLTTAPPSFCWKPGGDHTQAPWHCPSSHPTHHLAECFASCASGYYWVSGGTCWARCESAYTDHGATCYWAWWDWYGKHHYWASRQHKHCGPGWVKSGLLCYRPCSYYGEDENFLEGCGDLACAQTSGSCVSTVMNILGEIAWSIASIAALCVTGGASAPAAAAGRQLMKKAGKQAARDLSKHTTRALYRAGATRVAKAAVKNFKKKFDRSEIYETARDGWTENAVKNYCTEYAKAQINKMDPDYPDFDPKNLDPIGIAVAVDSCKDGASRGCAAGILNVMNTFDPTGLMGVAAAFLHDDCEPRSVDDDWAWRIYWQYYR